MSLSKMIKILLNADISVYRCDEYVLKELKQEDL